MTARTIPLPAWTKPPLTTNRVRGNPVAHGHKTRAVLEEVQQVIADACIPAMDGPLSITLHFIPGTWHRRDADGLAMTYKVCQDALVREGVIDGDHFVTVPRVSMWIHEPDKTAEVRFWMTVEEM